MMMPPEIYTGAQFTLRYNECEERITDYYQHTDDEDVTTTFAFGFAAAWQKAADEGYVYPSDCPYFMQNLNVLLKRLEIRDRFKELSTETPDQWTILCMQRFAEVSEKYEDVLRMEAAEGFDVTNPSRESRIIEYGHIVNGQVQDTPYGELNENSDYVTGKTAEQHSGRDTIHERNELDADILLRFRERWNTTMNKMVEEFDVLFIRITGGNFVA